MPSPDRVPRDLPPQSSGALGAARDVLEAAGYTAEGIERAGVRVALGVRHGDIPVLSRALEPIEPLATLVRLFLFAERLPAAATRQALGDRADILLAAGLLEARRDRVAATCSLTPWRDALVAHDMDPPGDLSSDHVVGPNPAAETLVDLIVPTPAHRALDLGTGSGIVALAVARQSEAVVATDINPHALWLARISAGLSGAANIELREGSLFDPVRNDRFGLIVANPPFVIAPDRDLVFRYSPLARDGMSREVVAAAARHLEQGGYAQILCNWVQPRGRDWQDVLQGWVAGSGCDALFLLHGVEDPLSYTVRWNVRAQQTRPERYTALLDRWLSHLQAEDIEAIGSGAVILRRRDGTNWTHAIPLTGEPRPPAGDHVLAVFAARDAAAAMPHEDDLLRARFRVAGTHRIDHALISRGDQLVVEPALLSLEHGLGMAVPVDPELVPVVLRLDGDGALGAIVDEVAADPESAARLRAGALELVRRLLDAGMVVRV